MHALEAVTGSWHVKMQEHIVYEVPLELMKHAKSLTCCSLAVYSGLKMGLFSLQFNSSSSGLFTVNTGMKNISRVHMVDTWNGLKMVSVWPQASYTGTMLDLKQDKLEAFGAVVSLGDRFEGKFVWAFNCCSFCSSKFPEGSCVRRGLS